MALKPSWLFLNRFIRAITEQIDNVDDYKPTQVFTKYLQRVTGLNGICYRSSKSRYNDINAHEVKDRCYVIFAENRDCLDWCEKETKYDRNRTQLILAKYEQRTDLLRVIDDYYQSAIK